LQATQWTTWQLNSNGRSKYNQLIKPWKIATMAQCKHKFYQNSEAFILVWDWMQTVHITMLIFYDKNCLLASCAPTIMFKPKCERSHHMSKLHTHTTLASVLTGLVFSTKHRLGQVPSVAKETHGDSFSIFLRVRFPSQHQSKIATVLKHWKQTYMTVINDKKSPAVQTSSQELWPKPGYDLNCSWLLNVPISCAVMVPKLCATNISSSPWLWNIGVSWFDFTA